MKQYRLNSVKLHNIICSRFLWIEPSYRLLATYSLAIFSSIKESLRFPEEFDPTIKNTIFAVLRDAGVEDPWPIHYSELVKPCIDSITEAGFNACLSVTMTPLTNASANL